MSFPEYPPITISSQRRAQDHKDWLDDMTDLLRLLIQSWVDDVAGDTYTQAVIASKFHQSVANMLLSYKVVAQGTPSMKVEVEEGLAFSKRSADGVYTLCENTSQWVSGLMVAPSANPRIDIVTVDPATGVPEITAGSESASPSAPATPTDHILLAEIYHRVGEAHIDDADGGDGYITDQRDIANY